MMTLVIAAAWVLPAVAQQENSKSPVAASAPKYQATVHKPEKSTEQKSAAAASRQQIFLRADIESRGLGGLKCDVEPYTTDKSGLSTEEFGKLASSPIVVSRVNKWRTWYSKVFNEIASTGDIPEDVGAKINVSVGKNGSVDANFEWINPCKPSSKEFAENVRQKILNLKTKQWIAFPENSYLALVTFSLYLNAENSYQLGNDIQPVDFD